jgi:hypothetical protein
MKNRIIKRVMQHFKDERAGPVLDKMNMSMAHSLRYFYPVNAITGGCCAAHACQGILRGRKSTVSVPAQVKVLIAFPVHETSVNG